MFQSGIARPGALQIVLDTKMQRAQTLHFQLDLVVVLEPTQAPVVGPSGDDISGFQLVDGTDPLDDSRYLMGHVVGVKRLLQVFVDPEVYGQLLGIVYLVGGDR